MFLYYWVAEYNLPRLITIVIVIIKKKQLEENVYIIVSLKLFVWIYSKNITFWILATLDLIHVSFMLSVIIFLLQPTQRMTDIYCYKLMTFVAVYKLEQVVKYIRKILNTYVLLSVTILVSKDKQKLRCNWFLKKSDHNILQCM